MLHQERDEEFGEPNNKHRFIVFSLYNDEDQNVHVDEAKEIDLSRIIQHLDSGGSVFITHRRRPKSYESVPYDEESEEVTFQLSTPGSMANLFVASGVIFKTREGHLVNIYRRRGDRIPQIYISESAS